MRKTRSLFWWITSVYSAFLTFSGYAYYAFFKSSSIALTLYLIIMAIGSIAYIIAIILIHFGKE